MDRNASPGLNANEISVAIKRRRWMILVFTVLLTAAGAAYGLLIQKELYQIRFSFFISGKEHIDTDTRAALEGIIKSDSFARQVSYATQGSVPYKNIQQSMRTTSRTNRIIIITISGDTPTEIMDVAQATSTSLLATAPQFFPIEIRVLDYPAAENVIWCNRILPIILAALLAGLILSVSLALLLNYLQPAIITAADVNRHLNLPCLGHIARTKRHSSPIGDMNHDQKKALSL